MWRSPEYYPILGRTLGASLVNIRNPDQSSLRNLECFEGIKTVEYKIELKISVELWKDPFDNFFFQYVV